MHELTAAQWGVVAVLGILVGGFTAVASYLINELMFRRRMARQDRELHSPDAPADIVDLPAARDGEDH